MFDPAKYRELVLDILWSQRDQITYISNTGFNVLPAEGLWKLAVWRAALLFESTGHKFEVYETYGRDAAGTPLRRRNYRLVDHEGNEIFLFDTHGRESPFNEPCHVHIANGEVLENGHGKLCGYDLTNIDFCKAFKLAYHYIFDDEELPWE